jgi:hypothetical protein
MGESEANENIDTAQKAGQGGRLADGQLERITQWVSARSEIEKFTRNRRVLWI